MMASQATVAEQTQYLGFVVADEEYAIGILRVREILEYDTVTKVPTTPPSIRGVINLPASEVEPPPSFGTRVRVDCLLGMGRAGKKFVLLLDIDKVLSAEELAAAVADTAIPESVEADPTTGPVEAAS